MINDSEIKALIYLLDDTDHEVVSQVEERLFQLGKEVIPALEQNFDIGDINELRQRRIDEIIKKIQSQTLTSDLRNWKKNNQDDLLEGVYIINRVKYPDVEKQYIDNFMLFLGEDSVIFSLITIGTSCFEDHFINCEN